MKYVIANWKANKNLPEAREWLKIFFSQYVPNPDCTVVICPPFPLIYPLQQEAAGKKVMWGAQDLSATDRGAFTGEVPAYTLQDLVSYAVVGHSERRQAGETQSQIEQKLMLARTFHIEPILCVRNTEDVIYEEAAFVAYEPVAAIGTGNNEDPEEVVKMKKQLNLRTQVKYIYGGSVNPDNIRAFASHPEIDGYLVGTASLDPAAFAEIIKNI